MPVWSNEVPTSPRGPALPLKRTPTGRPILALITSDDLIGCYTHFWGGHTVPCEGKNCEACFSGVPYRWHGYLAAVENGTHLHFIFECTAQAAETFKDFHKHNGSLRGALFEAKRLRSAPNSRVCIRLKPADLREQHLPQAPDLRLCMATIWGLKNGDAQIDGLLKNVGKIAVDQDRVPPDAFPLNKQKPPEQPKKV